MALIALPSKVFSDRFPTWTRIEPRARDDDFSAGLEARTADPLWLLGRQWQMAEFDGEDTGSAIAVSVSFASSLVTKATWPPSMPTRERAAGPPLDTMIESEDFRWDWRRRVQTGQRFEALIREFAGMAAQAMIAKLRRVMPVPANGDPGEVLDAPSRGYLALMAGRVIDGKRVSDKVNWAANPVAAPVDWTLTAEETALAATPLALLKRWLNEVYPSWGDSAAWNAERLRHEFTLQVQGNRQLLTKEHTGGPVDWFDVRLTPGATPVATTTVRAVPSRVAFAGAPHPRWWAFEDNRLQLGELEIDSTDIAKLALVEFALVYANDWLSIPLALAAGRLVEVATVTVTDVFGRHHDLTPSENLEGVGTRRWQLYAPALETDPTGPGVSRTLFVPPVSSDPLEMPIEEVLYLRDEGANLVFAVEHRVTNARGDVVPGIEAQRERGFAGEDDEPPSAGMPNFRLATPVPGNWFPFVPVARDRELREVRLRKARLLRNPADRAPTPNNPIGSLVRDGGDWLEEASVARSGVKVQLVRRRARGVDGRTHVWVGRQVTVGKGEGNSGLRFDVLKEGGAK
jgi:hypothetical protein